MTYSSKAKAPDKLSASHLNYQKELNPAQYQAVTTVEGPVLVIAGAGSGKTRTLVYRLAYLVDQGVPPEQILLLTFTRKAAHEMLSRAAQLLNRHLGQVMGGTFHSVCYQWLREFAHLLGYASGFTVMDRADQGDLLQMIKEALGFKALAPPFPRKETLADIQGAMVNKKLSLANILHRDYPQFINHEGPLAKLFAAYRQEKRQQGLMDYDDLLVNGKLLLLEHEDVRRELSGRYHYLMVDEYQDTNHLQAELVRLLAYTHNNVMVVGDDCQSIYSFRGANFRNIMDFPQIFPGAVIIKLEENYRSTQPVLDLANAIIAEAREKYTKCLYSRQPDGCRPRLVCAADEKEQSLLVTSEVKNLLRQGVSLPQIAVLFRAGYHSFDLEIELGRAGIPFMKFGGFKFLESAHIKDLLAYVRVVANPRDALSWKRLLLLQPGVGARTAQNFLARIKGGFPLEEAQKCLAQQRQGSLKQLADLLGQLGDTHQTLVSRLGLALEHYEPLLASRFDDYPRRQRDLEHLLAITSRYHDLRSFLTDLSLEPPASLADVARPTHEYLTLSTIHSAKGLEWEAVFIIWAAEGRFPTFYAEEKKEEEEEERRLMYVAVTRAKRHLIITYPHVGYNRFVGMSVNLPSRYVANLPRKVLESWRATISEP